MHTLTTKKRGELALGIGFIFIATVVTLGLGEIAIRVIASHHLIYNIEMVKYAEELKMADPLGEVGFVHRPSSSAAHGRGHFAQFARRPRAGIEKPQTAELQTRSGHGQFHHHGLGRAV